MSLTSVDLPEPLTPVTATKLPSGNEADTSRRLCSLAPWTVITRAVLRAPDGGHLDRAPAAQVLAGDRLRAGEQVGHGAADDDLAAVLPRARADVDDPVGGLDGVLVVLDDDQGVAQVAQPDERLDEPVVVPLVQPDAGLVEHVEHSDQARADLGREPDALRLPAGQGAGRPVEREVVQADVDEELQPLVDLLEHPRRRSAASRSESCSPAQHVGRLADRQGGDVGDAVVLDGDGQGDGLQPRAARRQRRAPRA